MVLQHSGITVFGAPDNETVAFYRRFFNAVQQPEFLECGVGRHNFVKYDKCGGHFGSVQVQEDAGAFRFFYFIRVGLRDVAFQIGVVGFAGMMAGGVVMSTWGGFKSRGKTLSVGLLAFGSFAIGMGLSQNFILYLGLMVFYGVALTMVQTAITTMLQEKTDTSMQGRVFGLLGTMYSGFLPIGMAIFGPLADILPLQWIMIGSGIALIIISGVTYFNRELKAI